MTIKDIEILDIKTKWMREKMNFFVKSHLICYGTLFQNKIIFMVWQKVKLTKNYENIFI